MSTENRTRQCHALMRHALSEFIVNNVHLEVQSENENRSFFGYLRYNSKLDTYIVDVYVFKLSCIYKIEIGSVGVKIVL